MYSSLKSRMLLQTLTDLVYFVSSCRVSENHCEMVFLPGLYSEQADRICVHAESRTLASSFRASFSVFS